MSDIEVGGWYLLPDDRVMQVVEVDAGSGLVLVQSPQGVADDWPLTVASARWQHVPADGFRVRLAQDRRAMESLAAEDPVGVVALILADHGGLAETSQITAGIGRLLDEETAAAWWKRTQRRAAGDARIDDSQALRKRYRLVPEGSRKASRHRSRVTDELMDGYRLLDVDVLQKARVAAKSTEPPGVDEQLDLMVEAEFAADDSIDPTQRFLAGEVAVFLGRWTREGLADHLGDSALSLDLTRIKEHESRDFAIDLAEKRSPGPLPDDPTSTPGTFASAVAVGARWRRRLLDGSTSVDARLALLTAAIAWGAPGSRQRQKWSQEDFLRYASRVEDLSGEIRSTIRDGAIAGVDPHLRSLLCVLESVAGMQEGGSHRDRCAGHVAAAFWAIGERAVSTAINVLGLDPPSGAAAWLLIIEEAPAEALPRLKTPLELAYRSGTDVLSAMVEFARHGHVAMVPWLLSMARAELQSTKAQRYVLDALTRSGTESGDAADGVTLAGTVWPHNSTVMQHLDAMAAIARRSALEGTPPEGGPVLLRGGAWQRLVAEVNAVVADARAEAKDAKAARQELEAKVEEQSRLLNERREALREARTQRTGETNVDARRIGTGVLKPIARALDDSYESASLQGLQDQLEVAMARMRISHIATPGAVVPFDPDRHEWVGDGYPPSEARVLTPGYVAAEEGGHELVLAFARVGPVGPR